MTDQAVIIYNQLPCATVDNTIKWLITRYVSNKVFFKHNFVKELFV